MDAKPIQLNGTHFERLTHPFVQELLRKNFPIKVGYHISRVMAKLQTEAQVYIDEKNKLLDKHVVRNENGHPVQQANGLIMLNDLIEFNKKIAELQGVDIILEGISKLDVSIDLFPDMSIEELNFILPFFNVME